MRCPRIFKLCVKLCMHIAQNLFSVWSPGQELRINCIVQERLVGGQSILPASKGPREKRSGNSRKDKYFFILKLYQKFTKCQMLSFLSSNFIRSSQKYFFQSSNFVCQGSCWRRCHFCVRCYWEVKKSNNKSTSEFINLTIRITFWGQRNQLLLAKLSSKVHFS